MSVEEPGLNETPDQQFEDITSFENSMLLANPIRAMKLGEFLLYIPEQGDLKVRLFRAIKESSFWKIADYFGLKFSKETDKEYQEMLQGSWDRNLPEAINNFLDELDKNEEIEFSRNEMEKIKKALDFTFGNRKYKKAEKVKEIIKGNISDALK